MNTTSRVLTALEAVRHKIAERDLMAKAATNASDKEHNGTVAFGMREALQVFEAELSRKET